MDKALKILTVSIFLLALIASAVGLFYPSEGEPYSYTNHRGETVMLNGHGLYYFDTVSTAAQMQGNDFITLCVGLPLLAVSAWYTFRGSLRGRLLLIGTLGFFLYTFMSMSMLTAYNNLFLVYVTLFGMSLYAFILSMMSVDIHTLSTHFSPGLPRRAIAVLLFAVGGFLSVVWLGRIIGPMLEGVDPVLENTTTLVIQAMDLVLIVPLVILAGIFLLRGSAWGYLLASVAVLKGLTMALAVSTMAINMAFKGVPDSLGVMIPFLVFTVLNLIVAVALLRSIDKKAVILQAA